MQTVTIALNGGKSVSVDFDLSTLDAIERHYNLGVYKLAEDFSAKAFQLPADVAGDDEKRKAWLESDAGTKAWEAWMRTRKISEEVDWIRACTGQADIAKQLPGRKVFEVARDLRQAFFKALNELTSDDEADDKSPYVRRLIAWALVELGLRPAELLAMPPLDVRALRKAWTAREARQDYRTALIATLLANAHRDPKRKPQPFTPADFFPSLKPRAGEGG